MLITIEVQFGHAFDCALFDNHLIALCKKFCGKYVKETRMPTDRHQRRSTTNGFSVAISAFNECTRLHGNRGVGTSQRIGHPQRDTEIANRTHCSLLSSLLLLQLFGSTSLSASSVYSARKIHRSGKDAWSDCLAAVRTTIRLEFDAVRRRQQNVL